MKNILIDTDIGDDIDDALAVAVALDQTLVKMEPREVNLIFWIICFHNLNAIGGHVLFTAFPRQEEDFFPLGWEFFRNSAMHHQNQLF